MVNAKDLKQLALDNEELKFLSNLNWTSYNLDELMENFAECGEYKIVLYRDYKILYKLKDKNFLIDKKTYKKLKSRYKKAGFRVHKTLNKIIISWK